VVRGYLAYHGLGETADPETGVAYFKRAAAAGEPRAYTHLGVAYLNGQGVAADSIEAQAWLQRAVNESEADAHHILANELLKQGAPGDDVKAIDLLDKSMLQGTAFAFLLRGWMHENGRGGPVDAKTAERLYLQAAEKGYPYAQWLVGE